MHDSYQKARPASLTSLSSLPVTPPIGKSSHISTRLHDLLKPQWGCHIKQVLSINQYIYSCYVLLKMTPSVYYLIYCLLHIISIMMCAPYRRNRRTCSFFPYWSLNYITSKCQPVILTWFEHIYSWRFIEIHQKTDETKIQHTCSLFQML